MLVDGGARCIVAVGDSITDGVGSTSHLNRRWPDLLARRLQTAQGESGNIGIVNRGIAGNQLTPEEPTSMIGGRAVLSRVARDRHGPPGLRPARVPRAINNPCYT